MPPDFDDPPAAQDVNVVGHDVVEQPLVVRDDDDGPLGLRRALTPSATAFKASMSRPESVSSRMAELRIEHGHLEDLVALLLAAGEALVDRPLEQVLAHVEELHLLLDELEERRGVELRQAAVLADGVDGRPEEVGVADAGDLDGILEGEEDALAGPLLGVQFQQILALEEDLALGDLVGVAAGEDAGERALAGAVGRP